MNENTNFEYSFYKNYYKDIKDLSREDALNHWQTIGKTEGRYANPQALYAKYGVNIDELPPDFDATAYFDLNPDLDRTNEYLTVVHYLKWGKSQGRPYKHAQQAGKPPAMPTADTLQPTDAEYLLVAAEFDPEFYLQTNPDIAEARLNPLRHFMEAGWKEWRDPNPHFSITDYLETNRDIRKKQVNPFLHYLMIGRTEGRQPKKHQEQITAMKSSNNEHKMRNPQDHERELVGMEFDREFYLQQNADLAGSRMDPLEHFILAGWKELRDPNPEFSVAFYLDNNADVRNKGINPFFHYLFAGRAEGRQPRPEQPPTVVAPTVVVQAIVEAVVEQPEAARDDAAHADEERSILSMEFDAAFYLQRNTDIAEAGMDPLEHFMLAGWRELRDPNPEFSVAFYLDSNVDIRDQEINPFYHYLFAGRAEGRQPKPAPDPVVTTEAVAADTSTVSEESAPENSEKSLLANDFDAIFYLENNPDIAEAGMDPLEHFIEAGWREHRDPSPEFSVSFYLDQNPDVRDYGINPFIHYLYTGRHEGRKGKPDQVAAMPAESALPPLHTLNDEQIRNIVQAEFDVDYYLQENRDIAEADVDPYIHFYYNGWREGRNPNAYFDVRYYLETYSPPADLNPLVHYIFEGRSSGYSGHRYRNRDIHTVFDELRYFVAPSPLHEKRDTNITNLRSPRSKAIAYYLPQFHPIQENDDWWGVGFTEWRNVARTMPRFKGHYQPRIPEELGFYDLVESEAMKKQVKMAKEAGLFGFCFYYYWFNKRRVLEKPLDAFLADKSLDFSFSILWANENWTRRWDGFDRDVLLRQDYRQEDDIEFLADINRYFSDDRYIRVNGRPVFTIYRPGIIPNAKETIARWRSIFEKEFHVEPYMLMVQGFGDSDPTVYGLDGAVEFPPHKVAEGLKPILDELEIYDNNFSGNVFCYDGMVQNALAMNRPTYPLIRAATPSWDNDARRQGSGGTYARSTPQKYEKWLNHLVDYSVKNPFHGERFVFINAWNEWAEAAYLEPDVHFGAAYLNATARALTSRQARHEKQRMIVFTHDAYPHGAQLLVLHIAETLVTQFAVETAIIVLGDGPLIEKYQKIAPTYPISHGDANLPEVLDELKNQGFNKAIVNTTVSGRAIPSLKQRGYDIISLVHELPRLIRDYHLENCVNDISVHADKIVFAAKEVCDGFLSIARDNPVDKCLIRPQGNYKPWVSQPEKSQEIREILGVRKTDKLVINVGFADARKGFDIFLNVAKSLYSVRDDVHFLWLGSSTADIRNWLLADIDDNNGQKRFHMLPFLDDPVPVYEAADIFFLSSREDPFPTVVLEALRAGLPIVGLQDGGGFVDIVSKYGKLANRSNMHSITDAITYYLDQSDNEREIESRQRIDVILKEFRWDDYIFDLLNLHTPELKKISVVVPNYNYAPFLPARMDSIYNQSYPLYEVVVLDDCSPDNSLDVLRKYKERVKKDFAILPNIKNSGSGYRQWDKGTQLARGEFVWIAEADDLAESSFLDEAMEIFETTNAAFVFCDSRQIDEHDNLLADSYGYYFDTLEKDVFKHSFVMKGEEFVRRFLSIKNIVMNVSGVVWRKSAFLYALEKTRDQHETMRVASDWKMYAIAALDVGCVGYIAKSLNTHRRHSQSVTHSRNADKHYQEITTVQDYIAERVNLGAELLVKREEYRAEIRTHLGLS